MSITTTTTTTNWLGQGGGTCSTGRTIKSEYCFLASGRSPIHFLSLPKHRLRLHSLFHHHSSSSSSSSEPLVSPASLTSTVGSPPTLSNIPHLPFTLFACSVAFSATCLFLAAIPTLLAFKKAAESMAKLMDVTREELPGTMAAIRLSGMEISDLTMELSDLGQHITQGVRGSTRAVRLAEEKLHQFTNATPSVSTQEVIIVEAKNPGSSVAKTVRNMKDTVVKSRALWKMFFTMARFSRMAINYFASRGKSKS